MPLSSDRHIIDEQFSKRLRQHKAYPSGKVWNRLSGDLHLKEKRSTNGKRLLLVVLLLLLGSGGVWVTSTLQHTGSKRDSDALMMNSKKEDAGNNSVSADDLLIRKNSIPTSPSKTVNGNPNSDYPSLIHSNNESKHFYEMVADDWNASTDFMVEGNTNVPFSWTGENSFMQPLVAENILSPEESRAAIKNQHVKEKPYPSISKNADFYIANAAGLYVGFGQTFSSTFIVDRKAFSDKNLKFSPTFGSALMVHAGYNFSNKWGLEGAWVIHSTEGQRYKYLPTNNRTTSLEYNQKHVSFNYTQFPVMVRYKVQGWSGVTQTPIFVNYSLGVQYGRMLSYSVDETKEKVSEQNLFRKNEYAVVAGMDYDFITKKSAFFTLGIRTSFGSNLFVKDAPEDLEFDYPHNFLIGAHAALNFSLQKVPAAVK